MGSGQGGTVAGAAACVTENTPSIVCLEDEFLGGFLDWQWRGPRTPRRAVGDVSDSTIAEVLWQPLQLEYGGIWLRFLGGREDFFDWEGYARYVEDPLNILFLVMMWSAILCDEHGEKDASLWWVALWRWWKVS